MPETRSERAPAVDLARIVRIPTLEVMETDMNALDAIVAQETTALGFFTGAGGAAVSAILGWLASSGLSPTMHGIFAAATFTLSIFTAWFFAQWRIARSRRPELLREMRDRTTRGSAAAN